MHCPIKTPYSITSNRVRTSISLGVSLLFAGCSEQGIGSLKTSNNGASPDIAVWPTSLDFGTHRTDQAPISQSFYIENTGEDILLVDTPTLVDNEGSSFSFLLPPITMELAAGEEQEITVLFEANAPQQSAAVKINSNAIENPEILVSLSGLGAVPLLVSNPNPIDMAQEAVGCSTAQTVQLSNQGEDTLMVSAVEIPMNNDFSIIADLSFPFTLAPGEAETLLIQFSPQAATILTNTLEITSNDPRDNGTFGVDIQGEGTAEEMEDSWEIASSPPSDILFSVDLSSSMSDEAEALGQQFDTFINQLSSYTNNWQVMVVNADHGCNHSGILTEATPNYAEIFAEAVKTGAYDISFTEALLTAVTHAVEKTDSNECNAGFMRPDAMLHIIMLSDECEQSPNPGICGTQWQSYVDRIITAKGNPDLVRISAVAGDYPSGCGNPQSAEFGSGYWEASQATNGLFLSICSDWTDPLSLQQLASTSIEESQFVLSQPAVEPSITVLVNNTEVVGWSFDASSNKVIFHSDFPQENDTVVIRYHKQPSCAD